MLKDLFFNIWYDEFGSGWLLLIIVTSLLCFAICFFIFARKKALGKKISKKYFLFLLPVLLIFYQLIPVSLYGVAILKGLPPELTKLAIKYSIIPWQKGAYYSSLATSYYTRHDGANAIECNKKAYDYIKSYKYPCWSGAKFIEFYGLGNYDVAIELALNNKFLPKPMHQFVALCYLVKNDIHKANEHIDKSILEKENYSNLAVKAYILKTLGKKNEALKYYKKALSLCKTEKQILDVKQRYQNSLENETARLKKVRHNLGLD